AKRAGDVVLGRNEFRLNRCELQNSVHLRLVVQHRLTIQMLRKEEEVVDVALSVLAAAIGQQDRCILHGLDTKLIDRERAAVCEKISTIVTHIEELEQQPRCLRAMPIFRLYQKYRLTVFKQLDRTVQDIELVPFHVDFDKGNVLMNDRIQP